MANLILKGGESLQPFENEAQGDTTPDLDSPPTPPKRRATGRRSEQGRERASRNGIAHGIFSSVVVLPAEPAKVYKKLLRNLVAAWQPVGGFEKLLVEELAVCLWRRRRWLIVEGAEIRLGTEFYARERERNKRARSKALRRVSRERYAWSERKTAYWL